MIHFEKERLDSRKGYFSAYLYGSRFVWLSTTNVKHVGRSGVETVKVFHSLKRFLSPILKQATLFVIHLVEDFFLT